KGASEFSQSVGLLQKTHHLKTCLSAPCYNLIVTKYTRVLQTTVSEIFSYPLSVFMWRFRLLVQL
ncbi:hypothetical protein COU88_05005, partial [Candidatus Roizmanbacteria bacterium CG10_big_fil_rev_8_21_14_0_10_39_6]